MHYYKYDRFLKDIDIFCELTKDYDPDIILSVARGGVTFGHFLAERLNIRDLYSLNSIHYDDRKKLNSIEIFNIPNLPKDRRVLIVDDIVDSGESMKEIVRRLKEKFPQTYFKTGVLFYKKSAIFKPDYKIHEAKEWIEFFWNNPQKT